MIHAICDFCGKDTDRTATLLTLTPFQDFARYHSDDDPYGSCGEKRSFVICSECMEKHDLPNPFHKYSSITDQKMKYEKCLDNYGKEDFKSDCVEHSKEDAIKEELKWLRQEVAK